MVVMIARRDASFYNRPNVYSAKVYHFVADMKREMSGCGLMLDCEFSVTEYDGTLPLCRRAGCQKKFKEAARWL